MIRIVFLLTLLLTVRTAVAEEVQVQYRITGLFQPDRVDDLRQQAGKLPAGDGSTPVEVRLVNVDYDAAVATFSYDGESQHLRNRSPEQVRERIDNLLRGASRGSFKAFPLTESSTEPLQQIRIAVAGLDCKGCAYGAYRSIEMLEGVDRATVSFREGLVTAWVHPQKTNRETLVAALKKAQVDVTEADDK